MLKLVKWAYSLGVRTERHRIAAFLSSAQAERFNRNRLFDDEMREQPIRDNADAKKRNIEKRRQQRAVDQQVIDMIEAIFHADQEYKRGASVMFPDEGEL